MSLDTKLQSIWYGNSHFAWLLLPLSWLYGAVVALRCWLYRAGLLKSVKVARPVIVVGNITVGGTGKTPFVIWLASELSSRGYKVAVIARGYRGTATDWPQIVTGSSDPSIVGDEPVLIAQQTGVIVVSGPDRVADAERAIELGADIIISDDGLQHYRLQRDFEIAVMDGARQLGNRQLLPAGPLREPESRLKTVDQLLINQRDDQSSFTYANAISYRLELIRLRSLKSLDSRSLDTLHDQQVHVVTGIGNPDAFLAMLTRRGIKVLPRILPDHALFTQQDISFADALPVLMTAKDAVKCRTLDGDDRYWVVEAEAVFDSDTTRLLINRIQAVVDQPK